MSARFMKFEERWEILKTGIEKLQNSIESLNEPNFTSEDKMTLYTIVYNLCEEKPHYNVEMYEMYKETCEEYIRSKVLSSLREKKDDVLLKELLRGWSNYKVMTKHLSEIFYYLDRRNIRNYIEKYKFPSLEETSCRSFYHLVYEGMNKEIMDAIFAMMGRKLAGEMIDQTFVNTLVFYLKFYKGTKEIDKKRNINLISSDGDVFEVDYGLARMSKRFEEITETISHGCTDAIYVPKVSGKMLGMVVEYCKKHISTKQSDKSIEQSDKSIEQSDKSIEQSDKSIEQSDKSIEKSDKSIEQSDKSIEKSDKSIEQSELMDWDAHFVDVDPKTLLDLATTACYMKIVNLEELAWSKVGELIKDKTPEEIGQIFGAVDDLNSKLLEAD